MDKTNVDKQNMKQIIQIIILYLHWFYPFDGWNQKNEIKNVHRSRCVQYT